MLRNVISVIAGFLLGAVVIGVLETISHRLFPPPAGLDLHNPETLARLMSQVPLGAKVSIVISWAAGSFVGGFVAAKIATSHRVQMALTVGIILLCAGGYTVLTIPHPLWMTALALLLPLPMAFFGSRLATPAQT